MKKAKRLDELKKALEAFLEQESSEEEKASLHTLLEIYFKETVSTFSDRELTEHLGTPEKAVRSFSDFLKKRT